MSDKFRTTFPVQVSFNDGELPTASKMNGLERQSRQGQSIIGYALGDLWNQSGDSLLNGGAVDDVANMIPNIARYLGPSHRLNPRIPYLPDIEWYTHDLSLSAGEHEYQLPFPCSGTTFSWAGTGIPTSRKTSVANVTATGHWYVDTSTGYCYFFDAIAADWVLTYQPTVDGDMGDIAAVGGGTYGITPQWSQIPDPDTHAAYNFQGLKIQYVNGVDNSQGYYIFLPPRQPLNTRRYNRSPQHINSVPSVTANQQTVLTGGVRFWQSDTVAAPTTAGTYHEHYRYLLPSIITDNWSQAAAIPTGMVYLYDYSQTKTIIEGVSFTAEDAATPRRYILVASGTAFDNWITTYGPSLGFTTAVLQNTSHTSTYYKAGIRLLCTGVDLSTIVSILMQRLYDHDHSTASSMTTTMIDHANLLGTFQSTDTYLAYLNAVLGTSYSIVSTGIAGDDHPQYLRRSGALWGLATGDSGGMFGDLLMLSRDSTTNYKNLNDDSARLSFGSPSIGPSIFYDSGSDTLRLGDSTLDGAAAAKKVSAEAFGQAARNDTVFGYSAAGESTGYGPVMRYMLPANDFQTFITTEAGTTDTLNENDTNTTRMVVGDKLGAYGYRSQWLDLGPPSGYYAYATCSINLPFTKYCIVNVLARVYLLGAAWAVSRYRALLGKWTPPDVDISPFDNTAQSAPEGIIVETVDLESIFSGVGVFNWSTLRPLFTGSTTTPHISVDNSNWASASSSPHLTFRVQYTGNSLYIGDIVVLYRVKEF